ncbi:MAG: hypothetical protein EA383_17420 [Spirochaetaceae bacterium]|nr:MAG: hypothetical protein EA383_17420 [Spirochaetaceae bacterium]
MGWMIKRYAVYLVDLDRVCGSRLAKIRPAAVVSDNDRNVALKTVVACPIVSCLHRGHIVAPRDHGNVRSVIRHVTAAGLTGRRSLCLMDSLDKGIPRQSAPGIQIVCSCARARLPLRLYDVRELVYRKLGLPGGHFGAYYDAVAG